MTIKDIKAVILAAGKGTRMKSSLPKVMHEILGKSLLQRVIDNVLKLNNIKETFVIVGHQSEKVSEHITKEYQSQHVSSILQEPQLGTGDAVFKVHDNLKDYKGTILILCGDTPLIKTETLEKFISFHKESNSVLTVMSAIFDDPTNYGRIVKNESGNLQKIVEEKDANNLEKAIQEVNAGIYCIEWDKVSPAFFELTTNNEQGEYYLTDIVDWSVKKNLKAQAFILDNNDEIFGINSRKHLAEAAKILNNRKLNKLMDEGVTIVDTESTWISPETQIGPDSIVYPGCYIEGQNILGEKNIIGPNTFIKGNVATENNVSITQSTLENAEILSNSTIGPFAHLRDGVKLAEKVRIGNFVEIKKAKINNDSNIAHLSYIGDSTVGERVNVGAGTITANYNAITREKSETIIGNDVKVGSNTVLIAPITVNAKANIAAGSIVTKDIPEYALAITRSPLKILENWVKKKLKN